MGSNLDNADIFKQNRKSFIELGEIYFWTATINNWQNLLMKDTYKDIIINCLEHLSRNGNADVFAFVIMPNHMHLIWRIRKHNGKETTQSSLLKFTAHEFKKMLKKESLSELEKYAVTAKNKHYEFWQRNSLAVHLYTPEVAYQKLAYIHANPINGKWSLANDPYDYKYSTARFYELGIKEFSFFKDLREEF